MRALCVVVLLGGLAHADGGALVLSRAAGPFVVSVFAAPTPPRPGQCDLSVLVQARDGGAVVLDATVALVLRAPDGRTERLGPTHAAAANRLLQAVSVALPLPGRWRFEVTARRGDDVATIAGALDVEAATPRLAALWLPLLLPAVCVLLFLWREKMRRGARAR